VRTHDGKGGLTVFDGVVGLFEFKGLGGREAKGGKAKAHCKA
jgi:hypothetical protein